MSVQQPDLAGLEAAADQATRATQAAADRVADLENQLTAARAEWEAAKDHEMEARRALSIADDAQAPAA